MEVSVKGFGRGGEDAAGVGSSMGSLGLCMLSYGLPTRGIDLHKVAAEVDGGEARLAGADGGCS